MGPMEPLEPMEPTDAPDPDGPEAPTPPSFQHTLVRVMFVQVVTLILLWILQSRYNG